MSRILVTGGAGFVGSHTVRKLLEMGHDVDVLDVFQQYAYPIDQSYLDNNRYRFEVLLEGANIIRGNTLNKDEVRRTISDIRPETIIHFAALPLANVAIQKSEEAFGTILQGTTNLLEVVRDSDSITRFVYISSSLVYGDFVSDPLPEDAPKDPKEIYGAMKYAGEILVKVFGARYSFGASIVRPSAVYGPTDNNRRVLQLFIERAMAGQPLRVADGKTTFLDFSYVTDTAQGVAAVATSDHAQGEAFNITRGVGRSLAEAVEILRGHFPTITVEETALEAFRPRRGALDITKARELVGYSPEYDLEKGISEYVEFIKRGRQ
jgi:nucleoside-diphosphate-sugar epimerase